MNPKSISIFQGLLTISEFELVSLECVGKKVRVFELVPMDLLDKAKEITMTSLLVLYDINLVPLAICASFLPTNAEQKGSSVEEKLQEQEIFVLIRRKKTRMKLACGLIIREISMRMSGGHVSILRNV